MLLLFIQISPHLFIQIRKTNDKNDLKKKNPQVESPPDPPVWEWAVSLGEKSLPEAAT